MQKLIAIMAATLGFVASPVFAAGNSASSKQPVPLTDRELEQVTAGDALPFWNVLLPPGYRIPIAITVTIPPNGTSIVQANYGGNAVFSASAFGVQNVFTTLPSSLTPSG